MSQEITVLDKGFVRLVDSMGGDMRIVQAARVSYGNGSKGEEADKKLIGYLLANRHTSPFEQVVLTFHMKLPLFVRSQMVRHRTARINELSYRYTEPKDEFYIPSKWRVQDTKNKQGSLDGLVNPYVTGHLMDHCKDAMSFYNKLLAAGAAREMARMVLPQNIYTEWYWQMDLHNLFHFLRLRLHPHAQFEVREYAQAILSLGRPVAPWAFAAFEQSLQEPAVKQ